MIYFKKGFIYTVIWTTNVKEVQRDYPSGTIRLLDESEDGIWKLVAVEIRRY